MGRTTSFVRKSIAQGGLRVTTHPVRPHLPGEVLVGQQWRETWPKPYSTACPSNLGTPAYVREAAVGDCMLATVLQVVRTVQ